MLDLDPFRLRFDDEFPDYIDDFYEPIIQLANTVRHADVVALVNSDEFDDFVACVEPLIAIKNYKTQIPFPVEVREVLLYMIDVAQAELGEPPGDPVNLANVFSNLLSVEGMQLPTVSAIFHFCHPDHFPIVDRYINSSCRSLYDEDDAIEFQGFERPTLNLPAANTSVQNKLDKYSNLISFFFEIRVLQEDQYGNVYSIRDVDKALMVMGRDLA